MPFIRLRRAFVSFVFVSVFVFGASLLAQTPAPARRRPVPRTPAAASAAAVDGVRVTEVAPKFHLISNSAANLLLLVTDDLSLVAGVQHPALVKQALATLRDLKAPPVRYAYIADDEHAGEYGDGGWGRRGAITLSHEALISRLQKPTAGPDLAPPAMSFSQVVQLHIRGEDSHVIHDRAGYSDADAIIHFEHSGILYLGPVFTTDGYPRIENAHGGKLTGMIDTVDFFATNFANSPAAIEPIVPGRGPIATMRDLQEYRAMLHGVHDKVRDLAKSGKSLPEVIAAKPTAEFDARWGHGPVTPDQFVALVYESVSKE